MHFNSIEDLYLVRIFDDERYLDDFISGTCFRMNSVEKFRNTENDFQGDINECRIILDDNINTKVFIGNSFPKKLIGNTRIADIRIKGYIYCFFAIPKNFFYIKNNQVMMGENSPYFNDFIHSLNSYYENCSKKCFVAVFDAKKLILKFSNNFNENNYKYGYSFVSYKILNTNDKLKYLAENMLYKIIFEKDIKYSYQHEFRFYIACDNQNEYLEIKNIDLTDILYTRFELDPNGLKSLKI